MSHMVQKHNRDESKASYDATFVKSRDIQVSSQTMACGLKEHSSADGSFTVRTQDTNLLDVGTTSANQELVVLGLGSDLGCETRLFLQ